MDPCKYGVEVGQQYVLTKVYPDEHVIHVFETVELQVAHPVEQAWG